MGSPAGTEGFTVVVSNTFSLDMVVFGFFFLSKRRVIFPKTRGKAMYWSIVAETKKRLGEGIYAK